MPNKYFKPHERFDRNPHKYDIGVFIGLKKGYEDNLFIKKRDCKINCVNKD